MGSSPEDGEADPRVSNVTRAQENPIPPPPPNMTDSHCTSASNRRVKSEPIDPKSGGYRQDGYVADNSKSAATVAGSTAIGQAISAFTQRRKVSTETANMLSQNALQQLQPCAPSWRQPGRRTRFVPGDARGWCCGNHTQPARRRGRATRRNCGSRRWVTTNGDNYHW